MNYEKSRYNVKGVKCNFDKYKIVDTKFNIIVNLTINYFVHLVWRQCGNKYYGKLKYRFL